jgi:hypothetical protein
MHPGRKPTSQLRPPLRCRTHNGHCSHQVRDGLLRLILFVPELLQAQLSEALALVAKHDFPHKVMATRVLALGL